MDIDFRARIGEHQLGGNATHLLACLVSRLTLSFLLAGGDHASSSLLVSQPTRRTIGRVQLRNLG